MEYTEDLNIFLEEVDELLTNTEQNLVALEKSPSEGLIQEIFRAMHTIKGRLLPWVSKTAWKSPMPWKTSWTKSDPAHANSRQK